MSTFERPQIGERRIFRNDYAYPSLSGRECVVLDIWSVPGDSSKFVSVEFVGLDHTGIRRMAVRPSEIGWFPGTIRCATSAAHEQDEHCEGHIDPETECCKVCGVHHGDACLDCGGRGFHRSFCEAKEGVAR